jgi:D-hexose-6-phosphate mutarotase
MRPHPGSQHKENNEKSEFNYCLFWARRRVKNAFRILYQKFQIYLKTTLQSLLENSDIIFATCILHNYLRDQGVGQSDIVSCENVQPILKIYKTKEEVPTKVLLK